MQTDCTTLGVATDRTTTDSSVESPAAGSTGTGSTGTDGTDCTATGSTDARSSTMAGSGERDESGVLATVTRLLQAQTEALAAHTMAMAAQHLPPLKPFTGEGKLTALRGGLSTLRREPVLLGGPKSNCYTNSSYYWSGQR